MRLAWVCTITLVAAFPAVAQPIPVPSDPRAQYQAVNVTRKPDGSVEILTHRDGPSGSSFALREVDCRGDRFRYLGEGDTGEEAMRRRGQNQLGPLVEGAISWHVARFACRPAAR